MAGSISNISPLISRFFKCYCDFFNSDLESAILDGRNFTIIDMFRIVQVIIYSKYISPKKITPMLSAIEEMMKAERDTYSAINITKCEHHEFLKINDVLEKTRDYFIEYFKAYDNLYSILITIENPDFVPLEDRKLQDILVEYNNALAHLLVAVTHTKDKSVVESNIMKANTHLYRGTLDSYKEILAVNKSIIENNTNNRIDNKTFKEFYIKLRESEANNIGKTEDKKNKIIQDYKALAKKLNS